MKVIVNTPEQEVWNGTADTVTVMTELGMIQVFPGHASLQGTIAFSALAIDYGSSREDFVVRNGFVIVQPTQDEVRILVLQCERKDQISRQTAKEYLAYLLEQMKTREGLSELQQQYLADEQASMEQVIAVMDREGMK